MIGDFFQGILRTAFEGNIGVASAPYRLSAIFGGSVNALGAKQAIDHSPTI